MRQLLTNNCREYRFRIYTWIRENCFRIVWISEYVFRMDTFATAFYQDFKWKSAQIAEPTLRIVLSTTVSTGFGIR